MWRINHRATEPTWWSPQFPTLLNYQDIKGPFSIPVSPSDDTLLRHIVIKKTKNPGKSSLRYRDVCVCACLSLSLSLSLFFFLTSSLSLLFLSSSRSPFPGPRLLVDDLDESLTVEMPSQPPTFTPLPICCSALQLTMEVSCFDPWKETERTIIIINYYYPIWSWRPWSFPPLTTVSFATSSASTNSPTYQWFGLLSRSSYSSMMATSTTPTAPTNNILILFCIPNALSLYPSSDLGSYILHVRTAPVVLLHFASPKKRIINLVNLGSSSFSSSD